MSGSVESWTVPDLEAYRERVKERSRLRVARAEKAVERAKRAEEELAEAREEAERIEAGRKGWDALYPSIVRAEEELNSAAKVDLNEAIRLDRQHTDLIKQMKKYARGAV